jgi:hypothetical protein
MLFSLFATSVVGTGGKFTTDITIPATYCYFQGLPGKMINEKEAKNLLILSLLMNQNFMRFYIQEESLELNAKCRRTI